MKIFKKITKNKYIILAIGVGIISIYSVIYIICSKTDVSKESYLENGKWILPVEEGELDGRTVDELIISESKDIPNVLHKMANTMIVPADGVIDGTIEMTKANLTALNQGLYKYYLDTYGTVESYIESYAYKVVNLWMEGDFTNCVEIHNACTELLGIKEGEAIDLDYKNEYN